MAITHSSLLCMYLTDPTMQIYLNEERDPNYRQQKCA